MAECDCESELVERDDEITQLGVANDELQSKVDDLTDERDKYKSALEEIQTLSGRALP